MNQSNPSPEEDNLRRLIQAADGSQAQPDPDARRRALAALRKELRTHRAGTDFPLPALGLLVSILVGMGLWIGISPAAQAGAGAGWVAVLLGLNLLWIPISSTLIVKRRRNHD